jgi:hypothetical protein
MTTSTTTLQPQWFDAEPGNVGLRVRLPSGNQVVLLRPLQRPYGCWDCGYLDELGRVRMVRDDTMQTGAQSVSLTAAFLARFGTVVPA